MHGRSVAGINTVQVVPTFWVVAAISSRLMTLGQCIYVNNINRIILHIPNKLGAMMFHAASGGSNCLH